MDFKQYQAQVAQTSLTEINEIENALEAVFMKNVLGLGGEVGEIQEKIKKILREQDGKIDSKQKTELVKELGDVLWYLGAVSQHLGSNLEEVAQANLDKLNSRKKRNVIKGNGDNR